MSQADINRIKHMLDAALEAQEFMQDVTFDELVEDRKTSQTVIRSLEVICQAASKISKELRQDYSEIPWKDIIGMRNWLIHAYFDIDYEHIWNTVHQDLPVLIEKIQKILKGEDLGEQDYLKRVQNQKIIQYKQTFKYKYALIWDLVGKHISLSGSPPKTGIYGNHASLINSIFGCY